MSRARALQLASSRWSWYARDALTCAELAHGARVERLRRVDAQADAAALAAQQLGVRCDDLGHQIAATFAALVGAVRSTRERRDALDAALARVDASVAHWTAQATPAGPGSELPAARRDACARALADAHDARGLLVAARDELTRIEEAVVAAQDAATEAATALQQARLAAFGGRDATAGPAATARRLLVDAAGHLDAGRAAHADGQRLVHAWRDGARDGAAERAPS